MELQDVSTRELLSRGRFEEAIERLASTPDSELDGGAPRDLRIGALLVSIGRYARAVPHLEAVLRHSEARFRAAARAHLALERIHAAGDTRASNVLLEEALGEAGESDVLPLVLHTRAMIAIKRGRLRAAAEDLLEAKRLYTELGDPARVAAVQDTRGQCFQLMGRPERAAACYAQSLVKKATANDRHGIAISLGNLGRLLLRMGSLDDALECFRDDLAISCEIGDVRGEVRMQTDIARALVAARRTDEAETALEAALAVAERHGGPYDNLLVHKEWAEWHLLVGDTSAAFLEVERAVASWPVGAAMPKVTGALLQALEGKVRVAAGEIEKGIRLLRGAVIVFSTRTVREQHIETLRDLAQAYATADLKANALRYCQQAIRICRRLGFPRHLSLLEAQLREIEALRGVVHERVTLIRSGDDDSTVSGIGGYEKLAEVGRGAFGVVYKALDRMCDELVAVKVLDLRDILDARERDHRVGMFLREAEMLGRIDHPAVARVLAQDRDEQGHLLLVMDYVEGEPLDRRLERGPLAWADLMRLARGVTGALQTMQGAGVLHRDLKPANIILRRNGEPVVVDFGIALLFGRRQGRLRISFTGTYAYAAPEQLGGHPQAVATDLYALGVILYEATTGRLPVESDRDDLATWRKAKMAAKVPALDGIVPGVPRPFARLVARLLASRPTRRPASADEVMDEIRSLTR